MLTINKTERRQGRLNFEYISHFLYTVSIDDFVKFAGLNLSNANITVCELKSFSGFTIYFSHKNISAEYIPRKQNEMVGKRRRLKE